MTVSDNELNYTVCLEPIPEPREQLLRLDEVIFENIVGRRFKNEET